MLTKKAVALRKKIKVLVEKFNRVPVKYLTVAVVILSLASGGMVYGYYRINEIRQEEDSLVMTQESPSPTIIPEPSKEVTPTATLAAASPTQKPKNTKAPVLSPTIKPSNTPGVSNTNECNYDLNGPSGAIKVEIKAQNGQVVGDQTVELLAKSGCRVLDGRSADKQTLIARAGGSGYSVQNSAIFTSVPAGPYSVRIQYKGQWTGFYNTDAVSGQSRSVEIIVSGNEAPTQAQPTSNPKPICSVDGRANPENGDHVAKICIGNYSTPYQTFISQWIDFDGDGSWDHQSDYLGCVDHAYPSSGTYNFKAKVSGNGGLESDICQGSVTVE